MASKLKQIEKTFDLATPLFFALGEPARQKIILLLAEKSALNVGQIAEQSHLSRPAISHHLKILRRAALVSVQARGTENLYSLTMDDALGLLKRFVREVEDC